MKFTKMHGCGNDYVYVNCMDKVLDNPCEVSRYISDRHFGIGSDGLILICPSDIADFKMVMYNADGSEGKMCGNGVRCIAKYVYEKGLAVKEEITLETRSGVKKLDLEVEDGKVTLVKVDMGAPVLKPSEIPVLADGSLENFIGQPVNAGDTEFMVTCVSMGNPHAVV
ncbi:MAG: diaminopimelate epimerase, partial [Lachnospiraceae bacterium]|nr:diaminopimelate epimerase [Lachnospiraceae bacterium]